MISPFTVFADKMLRFSTWAAEVTVSIDCICKLVAILARYTKSLVARAPTIKLTASAPASLILYSWYGYNLWTRFPRRGQFVKGATKHNRVTVHTNCWSALDCEVFDQFWYIVSLPKASAPWLCSLAFRNNDKTFFGSSFFDRTNPIPRFGFRRIDGEEFTLR